MGLGPVGRCRPSGGLRALPWTIGSRRRQCWCGTKKAAGRQGFLKGSRASGRTLKADGQSDVACKLSKEQVNAVPDLGSSTREAEAGFKTYNM